MPGTRHRMASAVAAAACAASAAPVRRLRWRAGVKTRALALSLLVVIVAGPRLARADRIAVFRSSAINLTDQEVLAFDESCAGARLRAGVAVIGRRPSLAGSSWPREPVPCRSLRAVVDHAAGQRDRRPGVVDGRRRAATSGRDRGAVARRSALRCRPDRAGADRGEERRGGPHRRQCHPEGGGSEEPDVHRAPRRVLHDAGAGDRTG